MILQGLLTRYSKRRGNILGICIRKLAEIIESPKCGPSCIGNDDIEIAHCRKRILWTRHSPFSSSDQVLLLSAVPLLFPQLPSFQMHCPVQGCGRRPQARRVSLPRDLDWKSS